MPSSVARLTPRVLLLWVLLGVLLPRLSPLRPVYLVNTYLLVPALLGAVLLERMLRPRSRAGFRAGASDAALAAFLLMAVVSIALQDQPPAVARQNLTGLWRTFLVPFAAFWAIRLARPRERELAAWVPALAALCVVEVAVGFLAWFRPSALPGFWPGSVGETGGVRIAGTLPQADVYAAVLVLCATFLIDFGAAAASDAARWLAGGGVALAFTGVFLSFSRASWLGGLVALGVLAVAHGRRVAVPCVAIAVAVTALSRAPARRAERPASRPTAVASTQKAESYATTRLTTTRSITDRIVLGAAGLRMSLEKPLFGWGFGTYDRHARAFVAPVGRFVPTDWAKNEAASHCTHLSILAEMGILGYSLLAFPVVRLATATFLGRRARRRDRRLVGLWAIVAFLAVVSVFVDLRYVALSLGLGGLTLGLIAVRVEADEPDR